MANKKNKGNVQRPAPAPTQPVAVAAEPVIRKDLVDLRFNNKFLDHPFLPGILMLVVLVIIGLMTNNDYGICWDEFYQRRTAMVTWDYVFNGKNDLMEYMDRQYGVGFELPLIALEKMLGYTKLGDIYHMRHMVTHLFFLGSCFAGYVLVYRLFRNKLMAITGFLMLALMPRFYAHSFFNTKDIPFLCAFLITLMAAQVAFEKEKSWRYLVLGLLCGYTTSIRIMGIMLAGFILFFLFMDWMGRMFRNEETKKQTMKNMLIFIGGFCGMLYVSWPYLWTSPVGHFVESWQRMSHFFLETKVLTAGEQMPSLDLPTSYFPIWFGVTNPVLWLFAGLAGIVLLLWDFRGQPSLFLRNSRERNFILYGLSFAVPILAVLALHSVLYDDWRQLYFVYPCFVMLALYCIYKIFSINKIGWAILVACGVQVGMVTMFMTKYHPFQQVYFNELVSHEPEYLRKNYEMDYWGPGFKQAFDYLLKKYPGKEIKWSGNAAMYDPMMNNIQVLDSADQKRLRYMSNPEQAEFYVTNFRFHPDDYLVAKYNEFTITVLNSTVVRIYNLKTLYPQNQPQTTQPQPAKQ